MLTCLSVLGNITKLNDAEDEYIVADGKNFYSAFFLVIHLHLCIGVSRFVAVQYDKRFGKRRIATQAKYNI